MTRSISAPGRGWRKWQAAGSNPISTANIDEAKLEAGLALGAQAGEKRLAEVIKEGGFATVKRATETPFNLILEARP